MLKGNVACSLLLLLVGLTALPVRLVSAFSASSSFTGQRSSSRLISTTTTSRSMGPWTMYNNPSDSAPNSPPHNAWTVLSTTEEWISNTLKNANSNSAASAAANDNNSNNNPYARKEVSYVCENQSTSAMVVSNIFRLLREARERGEAHGDAENERKIQQGENYKPSTMRQTQVVVIPNNQDFTDSFFVFDDIVNGLNQARRNARDYVTDTMLENDEDDDDDAWSVAINCAHMHPKYGEKTPQQQLQDLQQEEEDGEVDVNLEEYKKQRLKARQSPYPTVVIEVRASPTPDFGGAPAASKPPSNVAASSSYNDEQGRVSAADIQKLEALFGKTAHMKDDENPGSTSGSEDFWDAIGKSIGKEVSVLSPVKLAQQWIVENSAPSETAAFTESSTPHVDRAYEFVFANIAMLQEKDHNQQYLVLPHFLSSAATSFEKWVTCLNDMLDVLPDLKDHVILTTFHPEHIDPQRRSPMPILAMTWKEDN